MPSKIKTCQEYRTAMMDAAAGAVQAPLEFRSHLGACASCRAAFAEETQLFAAIDTGLRAAANAEVPPSLVPRVRAELNERPVVNRSWIPAGAALAAAVALVVAIIFVRSFGRGASETNPQIIAAAHNDLRAVTQSSPHANAPIETSPPAKTWASRPAKAVSVAKIEQAAVIIPGGQKQVIDSFLASVRQGKVGADVLLAAKAEKALEELVVLPLDISPITVNPLADVSPESASRSEKLRR
jgi:hypothetical protein